MTNEIKIPQIKQHDTELLWQGLRGCATSCCISALSQQNQRPILVITHSSHQAESLSAQIKFYLKSPVIDYFPDWETLPYDHFSPHQDIISDRLALLAKLPHMQHGVVVANVTTLMHRMLPSQYLKAHSLNIKVGDTLNMEKMTQTLAQNGYRNVGQVMEHGEFGVRGSIVDLFPMGSDVPYRLEFFDNEIETIRTFDPEDQRSQEKIDAIKLLPARETPLNDSGIDAFRRNFREKFSGNPVETPLYQQVSQGVAPPGIEYYLPLFYQESSTFFDYLPDNIIVVLDYELNQAIETFWAEVQERYEQLRHDVTRPLCEPNEIFLPPQNFFQQLKSKTKIKLSQKGKAHFIFDTKELPDLTINHRLKHPLEKLEHYSHHYFSHTPGGRLLFCAESTGRRETLLELLKEINLTPKVYTSWSEFLGDTEQLGITIGPLEEGAEFSELKIAVITESNLFGKQVKQRSMQKAKTIDPNSMIKNLTELTVGAPVVHIMHGVGRYRGLTSIETDSIEAEYLTLEYAGQDKIYVPVSSLHLISRYTGADSEHAPLQKLGSKQWEKIKRKTAEEIRDVAAELLEVYSKRKATKGFAFKIDKKALQIFADGFPFEETPDQQKAIQQVINDMAQENCMDHLVCGDVGFGKTEVAMRAAFLAALNHKQVAVLVPTTLLATQHLQNFQDRFADFPIKVAGLSRMTTSKDQATILQELAAGKVDIIIGTHKLLSDTIKFKDLGLLIIDEEQRFGVRQKEKIKSLRTQVDILTLTATPIPRTLNMALAGTRDLSIIATPPVRRLSVKTFVHEENKPLVREAILREAMRGGQVYFLHNDVATINAQKERLQEIVPEAKIEIAHGQMRERELEHIMSDFYHQRFNVLVSTTIIESGIDIPSANTIIINRADRFGLAQLHQLRGRVGRSHHQAYAYLLTPPANAMTKDATKRLKVIEELGDLGVGFSLATYDLEIRGAGELLGEEQSGEIHAIGFSLYMEMLEEAVTALKSGVKPELLQSTRNEIEIELNIPTLLPKKYVGDVQVRLSLYKRLTNCKTKAQIQTLKEELIDRFGLLPDAAQNLFSVAELKLLAEKIGIIKIDINPKFGYLYFSEKPSVNPEKIILLIQKQPKIYQLQGSDRLRFGAIATSAEERLTQVFNLIEKISG